MSIDTGIVGMAYHCGDGNTYKVTSPNTSVLVTDPRLIESAMHTFIVNWRDFHLVGGDGKTPAGGIPPIRVYQASSGNIPLDTAEPPSLGSGTQYTREELIRHFMAQGFTRAGAIGIVANLEAESGLTTTALGGQGEHGLAQWKGQRFVALQNYAAEHGLDWRSKDAQLGFLDHELQTQYPELYFRIKNASDPETAAREFCAAFEVPTLDDGTPNYATYAVREKKASEIAAST